jgi:hypothetical protein
MAAFPRKHEPDFRKSADESRPGSAARENAPRFERHNIRIARDRKQSGRRVSLTKRCDHGRTAARPAFRAFRMLSAACWALPRSHGAAIVAARDAAVAPTDEERGAATEAFLPGGQDRGGIAGRRVRMTGAAKLADQILTWLIAGACLFMFARIDRGLGRLSRKSAGEHPQRRLDVIAGTSAVRRTTEAARNSQDDER